MCNFAKADNNNTSPVLEFEFKRFSPSLTYAKPEGEISENKQYSIQHIT